MTEQDVLKDPEGLGKERTTKEFIKNEIDNMVSLIESLEKQNNIILVGDRKFLDKPYEDCKNMTNLQVVFFFANWRSRIFTKYNGVK